MITRRDLLDIAALKARPALFPKTSYDDAIRAMDEEAAVPASKFHEAISKADPVNFAENTFGLLINHLDHLYVDAAPEEVAAYLRLCGDLVEAAPVLKDEPVREIWDKLQDAAMAIWWELFGAGIRFGAATEDVRRTLLNPFVSCDRCAGHGSLSAEGGFDYDFTRAQTCPDCNGAGYLPRGLTPKGGAR